MSDISLTLNGAPFVAREVDGLSLMDVLRDQAGLISPKNGCSGQGSCGCCTVIVDDRAVASCAVHAQSVAGKRVLTLEGLEPGARDIFARAFSATGALQCGFCIPGIVMRAHHLLSRAPHPTRDDIVHALNHHTCRCTGYVKIVEAMSLAARAFGGEPLPVPDYSGRIGTRLPRMHAEQFVLGDRPYIDDMSVPGMLEAAFVFSPRPRGLVRRIDSTAARQHPGVVTVLTAADVPGERYQGQIEKDWPTFIDEGEVTHCIGDILAMVVADNRHTARRAAELVVVDFEELRGVFSPETALAPGAPRVHENRNNLLSGSSVRRGDVDEALAASAFVETRTFQTQLVEHAFLEPESAIAVPQHDGRLKVFSQGQGVFDDRRQIASFLGWPEDRLTVTMVSNGGAFGGKEDLSIQPQVALAAAITRRPVKATLTREESIRFHPKRHPLKLTFTLGCDAEGRLTALRARIVGDTGAYASVGAKVLERAAGHAGGPYRIPHCDVEALAVYTNNPPCGAMRGFGANQSAFAIEGMIDILAERAGLDPWEMRWQNVVEVGDTFLTGQVFEHSVGIKKTMLAVKEAYYGSKYAGIACGIKSVGIGNGLPEHGEVVVTVEPGGRLVIHTGFTEMGQGFCTAMIQCLCEATGIDARAVSVELDTTQPTPCGMTTASRATVLGGRAVLRAAEGLQADLATGCTLEQLAGRRYFGEVRVDYTTELGAPGKAVTHMTYGFATQVCILDEEGRVKRFIAAHDVGKAINPTLLEGQIEGAIHMGLGYALTEELPLRDGVPTTFKLRSLGLVPASKMPETEVMLIEEEEPEGPFGAKGVGEIGLVPTAPAVAAALYRFDGIRRYRLPMKDSPAAKAVLGRRP